MPWWCCAGGSGAVSAVEGVAAVAMGSGPGRVIPPLTVRMARASNPRGTAAMWVHDRLDGLFADADFADWYPANGRRGLSPARLALVSVLQYAEKLTDRQAAGAVRCRLDWKYCLGLELDDPGVDFTVLTQGVPGMRRPPEVHRQRRRQGTPHPPAARASAEDPDAGPERPEGRHLAAASCHPRRLRGHRLRNRPHSRPAALSLPRPDEDARPTRPHSRRNQHRPPRRMLPTRHHTSFSAPTTQPLPATLPKADDLEITNSIQKLSQNPTSGGGRGRRRSNGPRVPAAPDAGECLGEPGTADGDGAPPGSPGAL